MQAVPGTLWIRWQRPLISDGPRRVVRRLIRVICRRANQSLVLNGRSLAVRWGKISVRTVLVYCHSDVFSANPHAQWPGYDGPQPVA